MQSSTWNNPIDMEWIVFSQAVGGKPVDAWMRTVGIDQSMRTYVTAALGGDESVVGQLAAEDGIAAVMHGDHLYVPSIWLGTAYPETRHACRIIAHAIALFISTNNQTEH